MGDSQDSMASETPVTEFYIAPIVEESSESEDLGSLFGVDIALEVEDSPKMKLFKAGLYSPGSGEICAKYIAMSASSVLRHPYYDYPCIKDPGIEKALLMPEEIKYYGDDGQELYLDLCKEMKLIPVRIFHRGLLTDTIDLRYYGINPRGMRAMCMALERNRTVKRFDLTGNYLDHLDASYHLGIMIGDRNAIKELVLSKCYIGAKYIRRALQLLNSTILDLLDLSENNIKDEGLPILTEQIMRGAVITKLNLSHNKLTSDSLSLLAEVIEFHDHTTHLDVSWNNFYKTKGVIQLIRTLRHSQVFEELNISFTGITVGIEIGALLRIQTLKRLDLSNNRLKASAAKIIAKNLVLAQNLHTIDVSCNPFTPLDALTILISLENKEVKLKELFMNFIEVNKEFDQRLKEIRALEFRQDTVITHGHVLGNYTLSTKDIKVIYIQQLVRITTKKPKKDAAPKPDFLLISVHKWLSCLCFVFNPFRVQILDLHKQGCTQIEIPQMQLLLKRAGAPVEDDFILGLSKAFPGPKTESKLRPLMVETMVDYIHRLYPEKVPTPTPPPTIEPPPVKHKKGGKGGKKGKK